MVSQALPLETQVMPGFRVGHHFFYNQWSVAGGQWSVAKADFI